MQSGGIDRGNRGAFNQVGGDCALGALALVMAMVAIPVLITGSVGLAGHIRTLSRTASIGMVSGGSVVTALALISLCFNKTCRVCFGHSTR